MIIDLPRFVAAEKPFWAELDGLLTRIERDPHRAQPLAELQRFHYLYERAAADLAQVSTFSAEPETRRYLEHLVARAYGEIHEARPKAVHLALWAWLSSTLPQTFRRQARACWLSVAATLAGAALGGYAVAFDPEAKAAIVPAQFSHVLGDPAKRVAREEAQSEDRNAGHKTTFSAQLMQNNIRVSFLVLALGMTWGIGTLILLFYNGVILGLVATDYVLAGQTKFLLGWLLPHGVIEIPAILIGAQAGFVLANALIGWGRRVTLAERLRAVAPDLVTLIGGAALLLVWAGLVEAFFSQYHEPALPYAVKIAFGCIELIGLTWYLSSAGRSKAMGEPAPAH
jgi:uncharacterized membrane protein SpoIIM required for sporulation